MSLWGKLQRYGGMKLQDDYILSFGDTADVSLEFDGTQFEIKPATDDTGAFNIGDGTTDMDIKWFGGATTKYVLFDVGNVLLQLEDVDLKLGDGDILQFGDAAGGDVSINWTSSVLQISPAADDTGSINIGDGTADIDFKVFLGTANDYVLCDVGNKLLGTAGAARLSLGGVSATGVTDGSVLRMGTSGSPLTDDQAGAGFVVGYFDSGATSGWPAGLYLNTNVTGVGGSFTALQGDATLTAAKATVTGIENFMALSTGGRVTGACRSVQGTIDFSSEDKGSGGVYSAACFNIKGEGAAADIGTTQRVSCLELKTEGTFSAVAGENFQTKAAGYAIYINGFTAGDGSIVHNASLTWTDALASVLGLKVGIGADGDAGAVYYIPLIPAAEWN